MVADPGAATRADPLRPLNQPRPVAVQTRPRRGADGTATAEPVALVEAGRRRPVARVEEIWCVEDEWWRRPISRRYYRLALTDGDVRTVYHDRVADVWYAQSY